MLNISEQPNKFRPRASEVFRPEVIGITFDSDSNVLLSLIDRSIRFPHLRQIFEAQQGLEHKTHGRFCLPGEVHCLLKDGRRMTLRTLKPLDKKPFFDFHAALSDETVNNRYFTPVPISKRISLDQVIDSCTFDRQKEIVIVATIPDSSPEGYKIIGEGRLIHLNKTNDADVSFIVSDDFQRRGTGTALFEVLESIARQGNIRCIVGTTLPSNSAMDGLFRKQGFNVTYDLTENILKAEKNLLFL